MPTDDAAEVSERVIAAAADAARLELWSDEGAPPRLRAAAAHLLDAVTDLRDALELCKELDAEGVSVPFGVLGPETNEEEILPQTSMWAAYRQLVDAAEIMSAASVVPPWQDEPAGWRPVADALTYALWDVSALESRAEEFASNGERPTLLVGGHDAVEAPSPTVESHPEHAAFVADDLSATPAADAAGIRPASPLERRRVEAGDLGSSSSPSMQSGASSSARIHQ